MKLVIKIDTDKLPQDGSTRTRYFGKILHDRVTDALSRLDVTVGEWDTNASLVGRPLLDEKGEAIGLLYFE